MTTIAPHFTIRAWRDLDPQARGLPGMSLGTLPVTAGATQADRLWDLGVRHAELDTAVDLATGDPAAHRGVVDRLCLVRDLTARAVSVDWDLRLSPRDAAHQWKVLSHLQPPRSLTGLENGEEALHAWRTRHYLCKLVWRQGPGFIQIRDRRWGGPAPLHGGRTRVPRGHRPARPGCRPGRRARGRAGGVHRRAPGPARRRTGVVAALPGVPLAPGGHGRLSTPVRPPVRWAHRVLVRPGHPK